MKIYYSNISILTINLLVVFGFMLFSSFDLMSQEKQISKGLEHFEMNEYALAIPHFEEAIELDARSYQANKLLGNCYRKLKNYEKAEMYFAELVKMPEVSAEDYLYYGQVLLANNKLNEAEKYFEKFAELGENQFLGELMLLSIQKQKQWADLPKHYKIDSLIGLNSPASEFSIQFFQDRFYLVSSRGENYYSPESPSWTGDNFLGIFEADTTELFNLEPINLKEVSGSINSFYHDGPIAIDKTENRIAVSRVDNRMKGKNFVNQMKLYLGEFKKGKWKRFTDFPYNSDSYSLGHACFADSGKTLYFSSNMSGGYGKMDLYVSEKVNGEWTVPKNLGEQINTPLDEVFPFYYNEKLYFSSDGHTTYGGLDIFYVEKNEDLYSEPINMKAPINSNRDDFSIYFLNDENGFFASNRMGSQGKDDIFFFKEVRPPDIKLNALFEYNGLPQEGIRVNLLNENDSVVAYTFTDESGKFSFEDLPYDENYLIQLDAEDNSIVEDGRLFIVDEKGDKLQLLYALKSGSYKYRSLPFEEIVELNHLLAEDESKLLGVSNNINGTIYKKLPGDFKDSVMVYLLNDNGEVIDSVWSDKNGNFSFEELPADANYLIKVNSEDPGLQLATYNDENRMNQNVSSSNGIFELKNMKDASKSTFSATNQGYTTLIARLVHQGEPVKHQWIKIYNKDKELLASVLTNALGEFQFNELQFDDTYLIELPELDTKTLYESVIYVLNEKGDALYLLNQLKNGDFEFNSLPFDEYSKMQLIEQAYVPMIVKLVGQLYEKLPGDFENQEPTLVYAIDESGTVIDSAWTDARGKFTFQKLKADETYTFKMKDESNNLNMAILDKNDLIVEKTTLNEDGEFEYQMLTYQVAQFDKLEVEDPELIELDNKLRGQVFKKLPGDYGDSLKVYIYDDEGSLIATTYTDSNGKFEFSKLDFDGNYFFEVEGADDSFQLVTLDENNNVLHRTIRNKFGQFTYSRLKQVKHKVKLIDTEDKELIVFLADEDSFANNDVKTINVNYRFDSYRLEKSELHKLDEFLKEVSQSNQKIKITSHTDIRGSKAYNIELSRKRSQFVFNYLVKKGINKSKIKSDYKGELLPLIDCEKRDCTEVDHRMNRRTEVKLLQEKN